MCEFLIHNYEYIYLLSSSMLAIFWNSELTEALRANWFGCFSEKKTSFADLQRTYEGWPMKRYLSFWHLDNILFSVTTQRAFAGRFGALLLDQKKHVLNWKVLKDCEFWSFCSLAAQKVFDKTQCNTQSVDSPNSDWQFNCYHLWSLNGKQPIQWENTYSVWEKIGIGMKHILAVFIGESRGWKHLDLLENY